MDFLQNKIKAGSDTGSEAQVSRRNRKRIVRKALFDGPVEKAAETASEGGLMRGVNAVLPFLYDLDELLRWRAVSVTGILVDRLAFENLEAARVVMRRLMWNLNDESGGIGWGSAETMGEILARNGVLAGEYAHILLSYAKEDGNYLELPQLQRGVLWGIGRLAGARPEYVDSSSIGIRKYLISADAEVRGAASWLAGLLTVREAAVELEKLRDDNRLFPLYIEGKILKKRVGDTASEALDLIAGAG